MAVVEMGLVVMEMVVVMATADHRGAGRRNS
jgi:hypothetical protein